MKRSYYLPACTAFMLFADSASAALQRIAVQRVNDYFQFQHPSLAVRSAFASSNLDVYRVYAVGFAPYAITEAFGEVGRKMEIINHSSGSFFNVTTIDGMGNPVHYDTAPNPSLFPTVPELAFDTYVSIGLSQAYPGEETTTFSPGFVESANHFQTSFRSYDAPGHSGGWSVSVFAPQAQAVQGPLPDVPFSSPAGYYVFLMQFAVPKGFENVNGRFAVRTDNTDQPVFYGWRSTWATVVPAPSAWGLYVAALLGMRRRRSR